MQSCLCRICLIIIWRAHFSGDQSDFHFFFHKWILWSADYIGKCAVWPFSLLIIIYFSPFSFRKPPINLDQNNDTYTSKLNSTANEVIKRSNNNDDLKRATHEIKGFQWIAASLFASHKNHCSEDMNIKRTANKRALRHSKNMRRRKKSYKINNIGIICLYICCDSWWLSFAHIFTYEAARRLRNGPSSLYNVMCISQTIRFACLFYKRLLWMRSNSLSLNAEEEEEKKKQ